MLPLHESSGGVEEDSRPLFRSALPHPGSDAQLLSGILRLGLRVALGRVDPQIMDPQIMGQLASGMENQAEKLYNLGKNQAEKLYNVGKNQAEKLYNLGKKNQAEKLYNLGKNQAEKLYNLGKNQAGKLYNLG